MIYTYNDILRIKEDMVWVVKVIRTKPKLRRNLELQTFANGLEGELWAYDDLLKKVGINGSIDSVRDNAAFLDVTSNLIRETKISIAGFH
ncbi:hypothetical protein [Pantoea agglomerans]|uniref:hypothetical protein n=1 Tax=Enterobacter agglomerans TaxID=549 RepID=UPI003C7A4432